MEIILLQDVDKLGYEFDVVNVKPGYARNFLIPQQKAVIANPRNRKMLEEKLAEQAKVEATKLSDYKEQAAKLSSETLKIGTKAADTGKIFGSVTNVQVATAIKEQFGFDVPRKKITLLSDVKSVGAYEAEVKFHEEVSTKLNFEVVAE